MNTRNGKIARLPENIRTEINRRLECCEPGPIILAWLNDLPEAKHVLRRDFGGKAVSKQNLSEWRRGGFQEWCIRKDFSGDVVRVNDIAAELADGNGPALADKVATVMTARFAGLLTNWNGKFHRQFTVKARILNSLCRSIIRLQQNAHLTRRDHLKSVQILQKIEKAQRQETQNSKNSKLQDDKELEMKPTSKSSE